MPASLNRVDLIGNLTRDPELRYTPKGTAVAKLGLALNRQWISDGEKKEDVTFVDVDIFGKTAESCGQYLKKGSSVFITGRLKLDQWDDKQTGQKKQRLGVVGENVQFLGGTKTQGDSPAPAKQPERTATPAPQGEPPSGDEVPF